MLHQKTSHKKDFQSIVFENESINAQWRKRFSNIREPNGYQLSVAQPLS
jgi:hypothetical protein